MIANFAFTRRMLRSLSVDEILLPTYVNLSTNFRGLTLRMDMADFFLTDIYIYIYIYIYISREREKSILWYLCKHVQRYHRIISLDISWIDTRQAKAWAANNSLSIIWKSDLADKMKHSFFQAAVVSILQYGWLHGRKLNVWRSLTATTEKCCEQFWTSPGGNTPQSSSCTATNHPSRTLSLLDEPGMQDTAGEAGTNS